MESEFDAAPIRTGQPFDVGRGHPIRIYAHE